MGHISIDRVKHMVRKGQLKGINRLSGKPEFCEPCVMGKMKKLPFLKRDRQQARHCFQLVHTDVIGPITPASPEGYRYAITFTDDYSCHPWTFYIRKKGEAQQTYNQFKSDVRAYFKEEVSEFKLTENFVKFLRSDGGGEYMSGSFQEQLRREGTFHETTTADTPEQNRLAEQMRQTLATNSVAMLIDSGMPKTYWKEAMSFATYIAARSPASGLKGKSPYWKMFRHCVDPSAFRLFGCPAYSLIPKKKRKGKMFTHATRAIMFGFEPGKRKGL